MVVSIFVCGHSLCPLDEDPWVQPRKAQFVHNPCGHEHCEENSVHHFASMGLDTCIEATNSIKNLELEVRATLHRSLRSFSIVAELENSLTLADFEDPAEARLAQLLTAPADRRWDAFLAFFCDLSFAAQLLGYARETVRTSGPYGWYDACKNSVEDINVSVTKLSNMLAYRLQLIASHQADGYWEQQTYDANLGVYELASLRDAGPLGDRVLNMPIDDRAIRTGGRLVKMINSDRFFLPPPRAVDVAAVPRHQAAVTALLNALEPLDTSSNKLATPKEPCSYRERMAKIVASRRLRSLNL